MPDRRRLGVLGRPIAHSKSPALHAAAYGLLGLPWRYEAIDLGAEDLQGFLDSRDESWRGVSLTMPHKHVVVSLLDEVDDVAELVGAANTVLIADGRRSGFNTDVEGIVRALADHEVNELESVQILGAGATAQSALAATARLGARRALVSARDVDRAAAALEPLAERLGVSLAIRRLGMQDRSLLVPDAIISTLPGSAAPELVFAAPVRERSVLFDVAYDPWPSPLARAWGEAGGRVVSGLEMLLHQAVAQVRVFVSGRSDEPLAREDEIRTAMRTSVGL